MRYSICAAALVAASLCANPTHAEDDLCKLAGETGRVVMTARQQNRDMSALMEVANKQEEPMKEPVRLLIIAAYEQPAYATEEMQARAIAQFTNDILLACYKKRPG